MKYEFKINLTHNYYIEEETTIFVEGITDEKEAESEALKIACRERTPSPWDAEHNGTDMDNPELINAIPEQGEEPPVIRCDRTFNMDLN